MKNPLAGIFTPKPPEAPKPEPKGGLDVLRARARAHARTTQGHAWLKDALRANDLDAFLAGGPLPLPKIALLIDYLGMKAVTYDAERDLLVSTAPEPEVLGKVRPGPYVPPADAPPPPTMRLYPRDPNAESKPARPSRSGWA
jgi:hypothetical protein